MEGAKVVSEWSPEAKEYLEGYLLLVGALARRQGEDAEEIKSGLREHVALKLEESAGAIVSLDDLRRVLAEVGTPEQVVAMEPAARTASTESGRVAPMPVGPVARAPEVVARPDRSARVLRWTLSVILMGIVGVVGLFILGILGAILLPALSRARMAAEEQVGDKLAVSVLVRVAEAENRFLKANHDADGDGLADYGTLDQLRDAKLLPAEPKGDSAIPFTFSVKVTNSGVAGVPWFNAVARNSRRLDRTILIDPRGEIRRDVKSTSPQ